MLPVALDLTKLNIALIGGGKAALRRLKILKESKIERLAVFAEDYDEEFAIEAGDILQKYVPKAEDLKPFNIVLIADIEDNIAFELADKVREQGGLVNVEDRKDYCDFFYSAIIRRGDLLIGVNTGGKSPALTVRIRKYLEDIFPIIWKDRINELAKLRDNLRRDGAVNTKIIEESNKYINKQGWF